MKLLILRFRAVSSLSRDYDYIVDNGRLRGCNKGDPMLVFGYNILSAEDNLNIVRESFRNHPYATITNNMKGSFTVIFGETNER